MGNIKDDGVTFDPFPKTGLVKQYEPFIRKVATEFCRKYPHVPRRHIQIEAVRLAVLAEQRFNPGLGHDFSTYLRWRLRELHRLPAELEQKLPVSPEECEPVRAPKFECGNGTRLALDLQWMPAGHRGGRQAWSWGRNY